MHPILFRIPIPVMTLPLLWVFLAAAGVAAAVAIGLFVKKDRNNALIAVVAAVVAGGLAAKYQGETWNTSPVPIYSYGVMLGLSLVVGWYLTLGLSEREGLPKETMANCYVVTAIAAVAGARVLYILTNLNEFETFGSMFAMRNGGLVAYGGFLGGFVGSYVFLRRHGIALLPWADVAVPSLASGLMITRIGCYLFGCDFGHPLSETAPAWLKKLGTFPHWAAGTLEQGDGSPAWVQHVKQRGLSPMSDASLPVHPTQIYESLVGAALLVLLLTARRRQKFRGEIFLLFTFSYGICRYLLEILRDDAERGSLPPALQEHVLLPVGLAIFALGYVIGFSKAIKNDVLRKLTQALAFAPAIAMYIALKPETFASAATIQYSTSQAVAVSTGFAACIAYAVYYKAALAHPESAMALTLPGEPGRVVADDDEGDEDAPKKSKAKGAKKSSVGTKKAGSKGKTRKDKPSARKPRADDDEEDGAQESSPEKTARDSDEDATHDAEGDDAQRDNDEGDQDDAQHDNEDDAQDDDNAEDVPRASGSKPKKERSSDAPEEP